MPISLTGANATFMISVDTIFTTAQQIQNFAADDVTDTDEVASAETLMGVDGNLSGGYVWVPVHQRIALQSDSPSIAFFDQWYLQQIANLTTYVATGTLLLAVGTKWSLTNGFLTGYKNIPGVKKLIGPRNFSITWERVTPAPTAIV